MSVGNVVSLLGAMRKAGSPLAKAKLLALTVRGVRQLSGAERRELLTRLGVEKADWFVDRLGEETNEGTAEVVRELIKQAGKTDPNKWQELAAKLRDPEERRRLLAEGLEMLDELPGDEEPTSDAEPPPPSVVENAPPEELPSTLSPKPPPPLEPEKVRVPGTATETPTTNPEAATPVKIAAESPPAEAAPAPAPPPPEPSPPPTAPERPVSASSKSTTQASKPASPRTQPRTRPPARFPQSSAPPPAASKIAPKVEKRAVERRRGPRETPRLDTTPTAKSTALTEALSDALVEELERTPSLVRRLRLLREKAAETGGWSPAALRALVELFPDGWARRRALATLLTAGTPADFYTALALVTETLDSPTDRRWCLGTLATGRYLTPRQREALLAGLDSPTWRRRLAKRLAAASG